MMTGHHSRRWVAVAVLAMFAMAMGVIAAPAAAVDQYNDEYPTTTCGGEWHWVHVQTEATEGTLTVEFEGAGVLRVASSESPSVNLHYSVWLRGGDTLLRASDDVDDGKLLLSHWPECEEPEYGSITVIKGTLPRTAAEFDFEISTLAGRMATFSLAGMDDTSTSGVVENQRVFDQLPPDTYVIDELVGALPRGYEFVDVHCTGGEYRESGARVGISLDAGDDYVCTFVNELELEPEVGSITVIKVAEPETRAEFDFEISNPLGRSETFTLRGMDDPATSGVVENQRVYDQLPPGTYAIDELLGDLPGGYEFVDVACRGGEYRESGARVGIPLQSGDRYVCTFVNRREVEPEFGSITVVKETDPGTSAEFDFEISLGDRLASFSLEGRDDGSTSTEIENRRVFDRLPAGSYLVEELLDDLPGRYRFRSLSCTGADYTADGASVLVDLELDDDVVCTFRNERPATPPTRVAEAGEIRIVKSAPGIEPVSFAFEASWTTTGFSLGRGETHSSGPLAPGIYQVNEAMSAEQLAAGWQFASATCTDGSPINEIRLGDGEIVTCTFQNVQVLGESIEATTTTTTAAEVAAVTVATLPFTGGGPLALSLLGLSLLSLGGLAVATASSREDR